MIPATLLTIVYIAIMSMYIKTTKMRSKNENKRL
jgi:hypothetical protein